MSDFKKYPKCEECEVFEQTKTNPERALICETARACGACEKDVWRVDTAEKIRELLEKAESGLKLCENRLESYRKEIENKILDKDFKRIHDIAEDFDLWRFGRDLSRERVEILKELLEALEG